MEVKGTHCRPAVGGFLTSFHSQCTRTNSMGIIMPVVRGSLHHGGVNCFALSRLMADQCCNAWQRQAHCVGVLAV